MSATTKEYIQISSRAVAVSSTCVALSTIAVLAVVSTVRSVDTLSVIALVLAILAFVIQIIVYIVQANVSSQQQARSEEIYGATLTALKTIEEKTEGTRQVITTINDRMLGAVIDKSVAAVRVSGTTVDSVEFNERLSDQVRQYMDANADLSPVSQRIDRQRSTLESLSEKSREIRRSEIMNFTLPPDASQLISDLATLPEPALDEIEWLVTDYIKFGPANPSQLSGGVGSVGQEVELYNVGLIRRVKTDWSPRRFVYELTERGRDAARLLLGRPFPDSAPSDLKVIRTGLEERRKNLERLRNEYERNRIPLEELPPA